jgi:hypothetical protein
MKWDVIQESESCLVKEIMPRDGTAHFSGLSCPCFPCLDGEGSNTLLIHHEVILGFPVICQEPGAHECRLDRECTQP